MNEQLPPLPHLPASQPYVWVWIGGEKRFESANSIYFTADQMRDYARAALAAKVPADPHLMTKHNALHMNHIALKAQAEKLADALHQCRSALIDAIDSEGGNGREAPEVIDATDALTAYDAATPAPTQAQQPSEAHPEYLRGWKDGAAFDAATKAKPEAQPLTAMQARSVVDGMGWALDEVEIEDMEMLVKAAERACAEAWGVKLAGIGASGEAT